MLYLHGARWSLSNNLHRIGRLHRMGFAVLAIDYRGFGRSDGDLPSEAQALRRRAGGLERAAPTAARSDAPFPVRAFARRRGRDRARHAQRRRRRVIVESSFTSIRDMVARSATRASRSKA